MGDRTHAEFSVKRPLPEVVQAWVDGEEGAGVEYPEDSWENPDGTLTLYFSECNYGENREVAAFLEEHKVSYDQRWGAGGDYGPGTRWVRFAKDGTKRETEAGDEERPDIRLILDYLYDGQTVAGTALLETWFTEHSEPCKLGGEPDTWE